MEQAKFEGLAAEVKSLRFQLKTVEALKRSKMKDYYKILGKDIYLLWFDSELISRVERLKEEGNTAFKDGRLQDAIDRYTDALDVRFSSSFADH